MFLRKAAFFILIILSQFSQAQRKKKTDTVYVYEKVIVYDTIYLEKPLLIKFRDIAFPALAIADKKIIQFNPKIRKTRTQKYIRRATFHYGAEAGMGLKSNSWSKEFSDKLQWGETIGIWAEKNITDTRLSFMMAFNLYHWNSSLDLDANKDNSSFNGYYFTEDNEPLVFQRFNNRHFEYALHMKLFYEWKNIRPYAGISMNRNTYKMQFLVPENNTWDDFKTHKVNLGFSFGLQYRFLKKIILTADYQHYKIKNVSLKNSSFDFDIFKTNNTFAERKINLGVSYMFSR